MSLIRHIKTILAALSVTAILGAAPALAAGTLPLAMAQQIDINGQPLANCQVFFYVAGTPANPQNAFADFGLSTSIGPQLSCDQTGRIPMFWLADGLIHVRLTDAGGAPIIDTTMQVLGPSSGGGGGGGGTVDPTTILATGDLKVKYGTGPLTGFVRSNGLTIGNATSGATERANADTQALFIYLYGTDPNLVVAPGGRSGNALNDFNANKTITLPDWRGRALAALDDMGNTAAGRLTATYFGTAATVLGAAGGNEKHLTIATELPSSIPYTDPGHSHFANQRGSLITLHDAGGTPVGQIWQSDNGTATTSPSATGITINPGGGNAHAVASPMMLATIYLKL